MHRVLRLSAIFVLPLAAALAAQAQTRPPWPAGDEIGMANNLGPATWQRCAPLLANPNARSYEISHVRSNTMPQSPFGTPLVDRYRPTVGIPGTRHAFNGEETVSGEPGAQGTQMDAIGHFAVLPEPWDGKSEFPGPEIAGNVPAQLLPSGPDFPTQNNQRLFVALVHGARQRVVLTTPYFIPDEPLLQAMQTAAQRGVDVHLVVSERGDHFIVALAQQSYYEELLEAGGAYARLHKAQMELAQGHAV